METGKEFNSKEIGTIITFYEQFYKGNFLKNSIEDIILRERYDKTSINSQNRERYLGMLRNLIHNIWREVCKSLHIDFIMPEVMVLSAEIIRTNINQTGLDNIPVCYDPKTNTILISDEFINQLNVFFPIVTKDICIALIIAHEFGHSLINQVSQKSLSGKSVEHLCDIIAGFTLRKMEKMDLLDEEDQKVGETMFRTMGIGDTGTHGSSKERGDSFLYGYKMSDSAMQDLLSKLIPSDRMISLFQEKIITILNDRFMKKRFKNI